MWNKELLVKSVSYRFYDDNDKDITQTKSYLQFKRDNHGNGYDMEISREQFEKLLEDKVIEFVCRSTTELPKLNNKMPSYCYHNISVLLYQFKDNFNF